MRLSVNQNNDKTRKGGKRGKDGLPPAVLSVPKFVRKSADFDDFQFIGSVGSVDENFFSDLCGRHPGRVGTYIGFEPTLSQEIYAGADAFIMPSKSEPCGLAQMVACRYGTPPIIRETGGLRDSIHDCTLGEGNGFTFAGYSAHELYDACCRAQDRYYSKEDWNNLIRYDMECDFSWDVSAKSYEGLYNETANLW